MQPTYVRDDKFTGSGKVSGSGSREHFFHFLIGYLLPIVHAQRLNQQAPFQVLDCGPLMTPILEETLTRLGFDFKITSPSAIENPIYVDSWDNAKQPDWNAFSTQALRSAAHRVSTAWGKYTCQQDDCPQSENLLIQRSAAHEYYISGPAEVKGYGLSRRGVTNWPDVLALLKERGIEYALYEPGRHSLGCQITTFRRARRIAGMRGAEWANAIWSPKGARARVLNPITMPPQVIIASFFKRLDFQHELVPVSQNQAREDPRSCADFFMGS